MARPGQSTRVAAPCAFRHDSLKALRWLVSAKVVPLESSRATMAIVRDGQFRTRIGGGDAGVVPLGHLAGEDRRQQVTRQLERCSEARHVVDDRHQASGRRDHPHPALDLGDLLVGHRGVAGGEVDRACDQPADALAAADGVVLDVELGLGRLERLDPLLVQGRREGGAGAADQLGGRLGVRAGQAAQSRPTLNGIAARRRARRCVLVMALASRVS